MLIKYLVLPAVLLWLLVRITGHDRNSSINYATVMLCWFHISPPHFIARFFSKKKNTKACALQKTHVKILKNNRDILEFFVAA